jgi:DNA-binding MarR family transcriptional regulator
MLFPGLVPQAWRPRLARVHGRRHAALGSAKLIEAAELSVLTIIVITYIIAAMTKRLQVEIKQTRPFRSLEEEVLLGLARTADVLDRGIAEVLKPSALTTTQYNVLRILRGAGAPGLSCSEVASRMITRDPDATRMLDRLEARHLVTRARDAADRRVVTTRITEEGLALLASLDEPIEAHHRKTLGPLGAEKLQALASLLDEARASGA